MKLLTREQRACDNYRWARVRFDLSPRDDSLLAEFERAAHDVAVLIHELGRPLNDWTHLTLLELDNHAEVQESPMPDRRFFCWALHGADSVAPGFRRTA